MAESDLSTEVNAVTVLPAASAPSASVDAGTEEVALSWTNNDDSTDGGIDVERSTDGFSTITTAASGLSPSTTSFTDSSISAAESYEYRIERNTNHAAATSGSGPPAGFTGGGQTAVSATPGGSRSTTTTGAGRTTATATPGNGTFGGSATFTGGPTTAAATPRGIGLLISAVQAAQQSAATATGSAAFVGSLTKTVETTTTIQSAAATVGGAGGVTAATAGTRGGTGSVTAGAGTQPTTGDTTGSPAAPTAAAGRTAGTTTPRSARTLEWLLRTGNTTVPLRPTPDVAVTAQTISLTTNIAEPQLDTFRALGDRAGDLTTEEGHAGAFRAIDRGGDPSVELVPGAGSTPPIAQTETLIAGYSESQLSPTRFEVAVELQRVANRSEATDPDTLQTGDGWLLTLDTGDVVGLSERQVGQADREGAPPGATLTLPLRVSSDQAGALLDRVGYPGGVAERSVPDGPDQRVDETGGRQTVTLSTPADAAIADGDWFVTDWSLTFNSYSEDRQWLVELALAEP